MRKISIALFIVTLVALSIGASAATWTKVGTSGFTATPSALQDWNNPIINSIVADDAGNIYATANNGNNNGVSGGLTIFKPGGTKIDVDVNGMGQPGGITKLVKAGDGKIYGLQNWCNITNGGNSSLNWKIVRINSDGTIANVVSLIPQISGWLKDMNDSPSVVDLGGGNSGVKVTDSDAAGYDQYWWSGFTNQQASLGAKFRVDSYTGTNSAILHLTCGGPTGNNSPMIGIKLINGRFALYNINANTQIVDIAAVDTNFHEIYIYVDAATDSATVIWDSTQIFTGTGVGTLLNTTTGYAEWGASTYYGKGGTSVVTFDWIGWGPGNITSPTGAWTDLVDGSALPTLAKNNKIGGMAVGGDGNIYYTMQGTDWYWRTHYFWRYNVLSGLIEEASTAGIDQGFGEAHRLLDLEYLGNNTFAVLGGQNGTTSWSLQPMWWDANRQSVAANIVNPTWGRKWVTVAAYDPVRKKFWAGGRSEAPGGNGGQTWFKDASDAGTIVDLGSGNKGVTQTDGDAAGYDQYYAQIDVWGPSTMGLRFRVDATSGADTRIMHLYAGVKKLTVKSPSAVALDLRGGRYILWDIIANTQLADIGPVTTGVFNDIWVFVDSLNHKAKVWFNGNPIPVFDGPVAGVATLDKDWPTWPEFGASMAALKTSNGTSTLTFDWAGYGPNEIAPVANPATVFPRYWDGSILPHAMPVFLSNIMSRWNGEVLDQTVFNSSSFAVKSYDHLHANGYDEMFSPVPMKNNKGHYWLTALTVNPVDGKAWYAFGSQAAYAYNPIDHVYTLSGYTTSTINPLGDQGVPEASANISALTFINGKAYATVCNLTTGAYSLYTADVPVAGQTTVAQPKSAGQGAHFQTDTAKIVTYPQSRGVLKHFYIQDADRTGGIKVIVSDPTQIGIRGDKVNVMGIVDTVDGEAVVYATSVTTDSTGNSDPKPLGLVGKNVGGSVIGAQPATVPGAGLNSTGLFVRVAGKYGAYVTDDVATIFGGSRWFTIDDGSGAVTKYNNGATDVTVNGIKVIMDLDLPVGTPITVNGVASLDPGWDIGGTAGYEIFYPGQRVIITRDANDVRRLDQ